MTFKAFADDTSSIMLDNLTLENQGDRLSIYGSLQITQDQLGLKDAKALALILTQVIEFLEQQANLPEHITPPDDAEEVENPFWQQPK